MSEEDFATLLGLGVVTGQNINDGDVIMELNNNNRSADAEHGSSFNARYLEAVSSKTCVITPYISASQLQERLTARNVWWHAPTPDQVQFSIDLDWQKDPVFFTYMAGNVVGTKPDAGTAGQQGPKLIALTRLLVSNAPTFDKLDLFAEKVAQLLGFEDVASCCIQSSEISAKAKLPVKVFIEAFKRNLEATRKFHSWQSINTQPLSLTDLTLRSKDFPHLVVSVSRNGWLFVAGANSVGECSTCLTSVSRLLSIVIPDINGHFTYFTNVDCPASEMTKFLFQPFSFIPRPADTVA